MGGKTLAASGERAASLGTLQLKVSLQEIIHYSGVACRRTPKFENPMALGLLISRLITVLTAALEPCPGCGQAGTCERCEWGYHRRCAKRLKDRKYASSRAPIYNRLQRSRDTSCMVELVYVEEGKLPEVKHGPATTPPVPKPTAPNIAAPTAGKTNTPPAPTRATPSAAAAYGC